MAQTNENVIDLGLGNHWSSYKNLHEVIHNATVNKAQDGIYDLENLLRQHKTDFFSLLKQTPKNTLHRDAVMNSAKDGIVVVQQNSRNKAVIPQKMVEEALLISELFNINELISLEFVITGSNQEPRFPGLSRGSIAVLLYYDSRKCLLSALKLLFQAKTGRSWSIKLNQELQKLIDNYTNELKKDGIVLRCIKQLAQFDLTAELDLLQRNQALGQGKYRRRLIEIIKEVRQLYADVIFYCSAQSDLDEKEVKEVIDYLTTKSECNPDKSLDNISLTLLISLASTLDLSWLQTCDECDPLIKELPLVRHNNLLEFVHKEIQQREFNVKGLDVIISFILAISAKTLSLFPINLLPSQDFEDEALIDECIEKKVFEYLETLCIANPIMKGEEFYVRRFHILVSDFVGLMPLKIKELRDKGDEMGRIIAAYMSEGLQPPDSLCRHFEKLLSLIARLYAIDVYGLSEDIWKCAGSQDERQSLLKFVNFQKFIGSSVDSYLPQILHQPLLNMLTSFARVSPLNVYNILKSSMNQNSQFSLDHIFSTFHSYFSAFRGHDTFNQTNTSLLQDGGLLFQRQSTQVNLKSIEVDILCASLELLEAIVEGDRTCCLSIAENQRYSCISTFVGLLTFPIPKKLKARILSLLSGLATNAPSIAFNIWLKMETLLPKPQVAVSNFSHTFQQRSWQSGISVEVEDIEPKYEEYAVTIAYLKALSSLMKHVNCSTNPQSNIEASLDFVINSIFLKSNSRVYKDEQEKWIIKSKCLEILHQVLALLEAPGEGKMFKSVFSLMSQILQENSLFRSIVETIEDTVEFYTAEANPSDAHKELKAQCLLTSLQILNIVAEKEVDFIDSVHNVPGFPTAMISNLANLFFQVNPRNQRIERLATLIKILSIPISAVQIECLRLLRSLIVSSPDVSENILLQIKPFNLYHEDYFVHCFVECIESEEKTLRLEALRFLATCHQRDTALSSNSYGFSYRLFGFDRNRGSLRVPGSLGQTFNCLHSIISLLESRSSILNDERCMCMEILYQLCKVGDTCETVLRFLRTSYDLLGSYLEQLQKRILVNKEQWLSDELINEIGWFFRILAIEIKTTAFSSLKTNCNAYIRLLIGETAEKKLTDLVPDKVFSHIQPEMPKWEFFDQTELWKIISENSIKEENTIDVKSLRTRLVNEVKMVSLQIGIVQTNLIHSEIEKIITFATGLNSLNTMFHSKLAYFEGWRELCEIIFTVDCLDVDSSLKIRLLLDVAQKLLANVLLPDSIPALITPVASVLLMTCGSLRTCQPEAQLKTRLLSTGKYIMDLLESSSSSVLWNKYKRARIDLYSALVHIHRVLPPSSLGGIRLSYRLLEKISKDVLSGQELDKVVSMSVLIESDPSWIKDMARDGTLRLIMDSLVADDREIKASKFNISCKSFYSFESKMALLYKISLDPTGNRILNHLGIVETLSNLECFDLYSFLIGQSDICYKMVVSILRLLLSMNCSDEEQDILQIAQFVTLHSSVINDILRINEPMRSSEEGVAVLTKVTSLLSRLVNHINKQLQSSFLCLVYNYAGKIQPNENKILINILSSYVELSITNGLNPLFSPSWEFKASFANVELPTLGLIISIIENNVEKCRQNPDDHRIIESCLYLLWHHLHLYISVPEVSEPQKEQVQKLLYESNRVISDMFFSKIQSIIVNNTFIDAFVRRIKGLINLHK